MTKTDNNYARLCAMMFLQYFVPGAVIPIMSHYLQKCVGLAPMQTGAILAMPALAAFIAPFFSAHIADRFISSERMLGVCHLLSACAMLALTRQHTFWGFLINYFIYGILFAPTYGLTNAVAMHHSPDARRSFGGIRAWGTAGWCVVAWVFGYFWMRGGATPDARLPHALYVSAISSVVLALYSLRLPQAVTRADRPKTLAYWKSFGVFKQPGLPLLCILTFLNSLAHQMYYYGMSPYLGQSGFRPEYIMPAMSIGQASEVLMLGVLWWCLAKLGLKRALIIGVFAQTVRYAVFAFLPGSTMIMAGIAMHGVCYAFFFTAGYIYVDQHSTPETRAGAQQFFTIIISGLGALGGALGGGFTAQCFHDPATGLVNYTYYWLTPAFLSFCVAAALWAGFRETKVR